MNTALAAAMLATFTAVAVPACFGSGRCNPTTTYCDGDDLHSCAGDIDTGFADTKLDCAADGRVCRQKGSTVACVFPDQPCAADTCSGNLVARCSPIGFVEWYDDCTHEEPGRTCFAGTKGATCGYPAVACPDSGAEASCDPDGVTVYGGCPGSGHPLHRATCDNSGVCTTANGTSGCVDPAFVSCTSSPYFFCSADGGRTYFCNEDLGLAVTYDDCAARGETCHAGACSFDIPCDSSRTGSWCSDGTTAYDCRNGFATDKLTCATGTRCTERTISGRTFANCQ